MPILVWGGMALAGLYLTKETADSATEATDKLVSLAKWGALIGGGYWVYKRGLLKKVLS